MYFRMQKCVIIWFYFFKKMINIRHFKIFFYFSIRKHWRKSEGMRVRQILSFYHQHPLISIFKILFQSYEDFFLLLLAHDGLRKASKFGTIHVFQESSVRYMVHIQRLPGHREKLFVIYSWIFLTRYSKSILAFNCFESVQPGADSVDW